jgi:hypothetical protein
MALGMTTTNAERMAVSLALDLMPTTYAVSRNLRADLVVWHCSFGERKRRSHAVIELVKDEYDYG